MENRWIISQLSLSERSVCDKLAEELGISLIAASMLVRRNIHTASEARAFLYPEISMLHDPFLMNDMERAVERLDKAVQAKERILVYGDYDVDGTTAVSLMYKFLCKVAGNAETQLDYYIPDRYTEGYGVSLRGIDYAASTSCTLIVALDCGIKNVDEVKYAAEKGIDFIICDHHLPGEHIPDAVAVLDAKRADTTYPFGELCGCGVGFKLAQAYALRHNIPFSEIEPLLGFVAMAIASDIVPIVGENRVLAHFGIRNLNEHPAIGIESIMRVGGVEKGKLTVNDLVFKLGPRVNACCRIRSAKDAVRLLITEDAAEAASMSEEIDRHNLVRKDLDQQITAEALSSLEADPHNTEHFSTVVCGDNWHKGVVGLVASRLINHYYRPTIVLTQTDGMVSGSGRSVEGFDLYSAVASCHELLTTYGGHTFALGLSLKPENLPAFKQQFEAYVRNHIQPEQRQPVVNVEAEISFADITEHFFDTLMLFEPFGPGNPRPVFLTRSVCNYHNTRRVGKQGEHLKLDITDGTGVKDGIAFGKGEYCMPLLNGQRFDVCYILDENIFNGRKTIQMIAQDLKPSASADNSIQ